MEDPASVINAIANLRVVVAIVGIGVVGTIGLLWLVLRYLDKRASDRQASLSDEAKNKRARHYTEALHQIADSNNRQTAALKEMREEMQENTSAVKLMLANMEGVINHEDSREIIFRELSLLCREVVYAFQISLRDNHYRGREARIRDKMVTALTNAFARSLRQLQRYDLAVEPTVFFRVDKDEAFPLVNELWEVMVPFYERPVDYTRAQEAADRNDEIAVRIKQLFKAERQQAQKRADKAYQVQAADSHPDLKQIDSESPTDLLPAIDDSGSDRARVR